MKDEYKVKTNPIANEGNVIQGSQYRITVLTESLIRLEYSVSGKFEDRATQVVWNRDFKKIKFSVEEGDDFLKIQTTKLRLDYDKKPFSKNGLRIKIFGNLSLYSDVWRYGEQPNDLLGTARTLDNVDGATPLEHGLLSRDGWSFLDDSKSFLLTESGFVEKREPDVIDLYFFGYGREYEQCLKDYYKLTGNVPLLPRYALGNWWSRYYKYTEQSYMELMNRFERERIPFSVAVIDMDWHITDIDETYGSGWTGYTWNKELFPNPERFLSWLHDHGMKVTLNVHPADGVRGYEECYEAFAKARGLDVTKKEPVTFDIADESFVEPYFQYAHHPKEDQGVDFWWVDWQQGNSTSVEGLDPLWLLNHYHYLDSKRNKKRGLTFSRYAGPGSHRYPVGFSGDTIITWDSLRFQPYFTATASNIGYGWWSHDIGGHMNGIKDDELAVRWLQFGVFSPIMRLHSSCNEFNGKEPWRYNQIAESIMKTFLRLRHQLIPYLYTMNRFSSRDGLPLIQPVYYKHPMEWDAYLVPNEYLFGTKLLACPITEPMNQKLGVSKCKGWLPEGTWYDFFTGLSYCGGRKAEFYRPLHQMPVFAKAGSIVPLNQDTKTNSVDLPSEMELLVFAGDDGTFTLWEDEGDCFEDLDENWASTTYQLHWGTDARLIINAAKGNLKILPKERQYCIKVTGVCNQDEIYAVTMDGMKLPTTKDYDGKTGTLRISLPKCPIEKEIQIVLPNVKRCTNEPEQRIFDFLNQAQIEFDLKNDIYQIVKQLSAGKSPLFVLSALKTFELESDLEGAIFEFLM